MRYFNGNYKGRYLETTAFPDSLKRFSDLSNQVAGREYDESTKTGDDPSRQHLNILQ